MGPFRHDYCRTLGRVWLDTADIRSDPEVLRRSGYQEVIDDPGFSKLIDKEKRHEHHSIDLVMDLGMRLRKALVDVPVLSRNGYINVPFSVPCYQSYVEGLNDAMWTATSTCYDPSRRGHDFHIVPYSDVYDSWEASLKVKTTGSSRSGFMCSLLSPYEYCWVYWDKDLNGNPAMKHYVPNLFDDATFAVWLGILPQPVSLVVEGREAVVMWAAEEPRVRRSDEMGRYTLPDREREVEVKGFEWRHARALALVTALEKMAANEPTDRYKSAMIDQIKDEDRSWCVAA